MSTDQFNFVGLTRSPVKRTPQTGYYDGEGHRINKGEPVSAATTERMSVGSVSSAGSTDPRRRRALHSVPANTPEASHTPSSVALLLSSISSKRAALSARRSTLPVPKTLQLSPAETTRPDPTMMRERADCASRCSGSSSSSSQPHYLGDDAGRHHSPPSSTRAPLFPETTSPITPSPQQQQQLQQQQQRQHQEQQQQHHQHQLQHHQQHHHHYQQQSWYSKPSHDGSPSGTRTPTTTPAPYTSSYGPSHGYIGGSSSSSSSARRHHQSTTPAMADPCPTPSYASQAESYDNNDVGEWSSDCSFTNGAVFSPEPTSLSVVPVHRSGGVSGGGVGGSGTSRRGDNEERSVMVSPISNIYSASKAGGSALRGIGEATPRCPETRGASPFPEGTMSRFGESSSTRTPASGSGSALLRVGGTRTPVVPESVAASSSNASRYAVGGGATPATAAASSSNASRYAARDRATSAAEERGEEELPDTPAAAATLAGMMMGGGGVADSFCGTVDEERSFQEEEEEEGGFLAEGPSEGSADAQVDARSTTPKSPLNTSTVGSSRSAMTPRRPRSAMALLDISAETPRRMIRGILGGASLAGMSWKKQQEQRFVPKVSKVTETETVEEETPRRFILGLLANSEKKVASGGGLSEGRTSPPNNALVGARARCNSSSTPTASAAAADATTTAATAAAARTAAAAATGAVSSPLASSSPAAPVAVAVLPRARERSGRAAQDDDTGVSGAGGTAVLRTIATSSAVVPVEIAPSATALACNGTIAGHGGVSGGCKGRQIIKAGVGLSAVVGFCVIVFGVFVLACLAFSKPALTVPIY